MQYMLLIYGAPEVEPQYGTPAFAAMMEGYAAASAKMVEDGVMRGGEGLQGVETATSLRIRGGRVETMDGPFAETKEQFLGFFVLQAETLEEAITFARELSAANPANGTYEIRPLQFFNPGVPIA